MSDDYSQLDDPTLWLGSTVHLWYQREGGEDFKVSIRYEEDQGGFVLVARDEDSRDPIRNEHVFGKLAHVEEYLKTLHNQVLNDHDPRNRFTHFQYSVPFFPSVIIPVSYVKSHQDLFCRFLEALELFFRF
jgi:hypothetical protein